MNKRTIAKNFSRAAPTYDKYAVLQQEIGKRLLERLDLIQINPSLILDIGSGTGFSTKRLAEKYPSAQILNLDIAKGMLSVAREVCLNKQHAYLCADGEYLPIKDHSIDFIFSNCVLPWFPDPQKVFQEIHRTLKPEGVLFFSTFGPDTLQELRQSFTNIDTEPHVNDFLDMHEIGDLLLKDLFIDPVVDREILTLTYKNIRGLKQDLKLTGAHHVHSIKPRGLSPKHTLSQLTHSYEAYRTPAGLLPATFEVIYGHAIAATPTDLHRANAAGVIHIPIQHLHHL